MDNVVPIAATILCLACPLVMLGVGIGGWIIARARGHKRQLSLGCMPGHGDRAATTGRSES